MTNKSKSELFDWFKAIFIAVLIAFFLHNFVFATSIVEGESMEPTLEDGERLIFNKLVYMFDDPERGDVIIIQQPGKNYVKRIIALPGETIEIKNSDLYIDGIKYEETFLDQEYAIHTGSYGPIYIPEEKYFVMGDNRAISKDSRNGLGYIQRDEIIGRSEIIIFPFSELERTK